MASWQEEPMTGQTVWCESKGNGIITGIDYADRRVFVNFYDKGNREFEYDELLGCFDEKLNQWVLVEI